METPSGTSQEPTWVPYVPTKDCSQGFCSIYCPQWCYFVFPPPPPFDNSGTDSDANSGPIFSPLVIAIIGVLACAFLLVSYYTIVSKYCGTFDPISRRRHGRTAARANETENSVVSEAATWHVSPTNGLDQALIDKITVWKYEKGEGMLEVTDCSVCLSEFREGENLRLLPKCTHAFHVPCIDTWLKSHSNCPLCRANIVPISQEEETKENETVVTIEDSIESNSNNSSNGGNEEEIMEIREEVEEANDIEQPIQRSLSMDSGRGETKLSIADVLQMSMEEELMAAKECGLLVSGAGSSRRCLGMHNKDYVRVSRGLHCVMSGPVPMKRSLSSGRILFKNGRVRDPVLPLWDNSTR